MNYTTTVLEDWVTGLLTNQNIYTPKQLNPRIIAQYLDIHIKLAPLPSRYDVFGRFKSILIDERLPLEERREHFFHELCHLLRHVGHQTMMPEEFRQLQEWDAQRFVMYAALPYHILKNYDLSDPDIVSTLSNDFRVTENLCVERIKKIQRNSYAKIQYGS